MVVGVAAKAPTTAQVRGRVVLLGAASTAPEAVAAEEVVAARAEHEQRERVFRARAGDVVSIAERTAEGWGKVMARLLKAHWASLADSGQVVGSSRRRWGHWSVSYRQTRVRSVVAEAVADGSFAG